MKKITKVIKMSVLALSTFVALLFVSSLTANAAEGKELTKVVTDISVTDAGNNEVKPDASGNYNVTTDRAYRFSANFDLKNYNGKLSEGDYFNLKIPNSVAVQKHSADIKDTKTQVVIAESQITPNANDQGGNAKVTLKNFSEYLTTTKSDDIRDITGHFTIDFLFKKDQTKTPVTFDSLAVKNKITHTFTSTTKEGENKGYENFAKNGNDVENKGWTSEKLAAIGSTSKGNIYSPWRVRVNAGKKDYGSNLALVDEIATDTKHAAIQYIPESLTVYKATINDGTSEVPAGAVKLTEGTDYTVEWNSNYTALKVIFKDGAQSYYVTYNTTTPGDGSLVGNKVALLKNNTEALPQRNNRLIYGYTSERLSVLNEAINANPIYKIKINKTDKVKVTPVKGAVYTITDSEGALVEDVTTDENGVAVSKELAKDALGKVFTIIEKLAPKGYKLDPTVYTVKIGENNSIINLQDEPEDTPPTPPTPTPNKPVKPNEPGKPNKPGKPEKPGKPNKPGKPTTPVVKENAKKGVLPKTGVETNSLAMVGLVIGLGALALRRKANK